MVHYTSVFTQGNDLPCNRQALFCSQCTTLLFFYKLSKVEMKGACLSIPMAQARGLAARIDKCVKFLALCLVLNVFAALFQILGQA